LVPKPLREARRNAWEAFKLAVASHGKQKANKRLKQLYGVTLVSKLNQQQCEELCHLIHMKRIRQLNTPSLS